MRQRQALTPSETTQVFKFQISNIFGRTDNQIQEVVEQNFSDCTVICIAHRLRSVIYCDEILVLKNGVL